MMTKGGLNAATRNLAVEYGNDGIRFNAVAPGEVDTPMHPNDPADPTKPVVKKATVKDIVDAVLYLAQGRSCERRDSPRGWRRTRSPLVAESRPDASYIKGIQASRWPPTESNGGNHAF